MQMVGIRWGTFQVFTFGLGTNMAKQLRLKTSYPGVFYIEGNATGRTGTERIYYIRYKRDGKLTEEKAGRQYQDDMTPARAGRISGRNGLKVNSRATRRKGPR